MYIIDGYNLLHTIRKLDELFAPVTDVQMCRLINSFFQLTGQRGELVFDVTGPRDKHPYSVETHGRPYSVETHGRASLRRRGKYDRFKLRDIS